MTTVHIADAGGDTLTVLEVGGRLYPPFPPEPLINMDTFKIRHDDVIVCAYPKSGTHWVWEIVRMLQAGTNNLDLVEKDDGFMEMQPQEHFDKLSSPRALNTHLLFSQLPAQVRQKKCKLIWLNRNPKDMAVSYYHHHTSLTELYYYNGKWKNYFPLLLDGKVDYGSWFDYSLDWEKAVNNNLDIPILCLKYEDIKEDPYKEVEKIATFLEKNVTPEFLHTVCECCSFASMRQQKGHFETTETGAPIMYRKGQVGDWKNWFTVSMNDWFNRVYQDKMEGSNLTFRYTLED